MKRIPLYALSLALVIPVTDGMAEPKKNEIFGFGRKRDQISNALFPGGTETAASAPQTATNSREERDSDSIFRGGKPGKTESSAYLIRDGEKVEQPLPREKAKPALFSKFKKDPAGEDPLLTATTDPVEEVEKKSNSILPPIPLKKEKKEAPIVAAPAPPMESRGSADETSAPALVSAPVEEVREEKKSGGGFFSFFNRDKKEDTPDTPLTPIPVATTAAADTGDAPVAAPVSPVKPASKPAPANTKPAPAPTVVKEDTPTAEVPEFAGAPEPREKVKEKKGFSLPNPIAALKPDPKPVSLVGAETIIENGKIVGETEDIVDSNIVKTGDGKKDPPRMIDGVKTYDSWEDVEGRNVSAADRILSQMRSR